MLADYLLSPLEVVGRTGDRTQEEHSSHATPVTMIWLVRPSITLFVVLP